MTITSVLRFSVCLGLLLSTAKTAKAQDSVSTLAGNPLEAGGRDGAASEARFCDPAAIASDAIGNLFVADSQNHVIRKISRDGVVTTIAGMSGSAGFRDGTSAKFDTPTGIAVLPGGDLLVSDTANHVIRRVFTSGAVATIAGSPGRNGALDGAGSTALFDSPLGIAIGPGEKIYVADCGNQLVRSISSNGIVATVAGSAGNWGVADGVGSVARFNGPVGIAVDSWGNIFVSDSNNHVIRRITSDGTVSVWAGEPLQDGFIDGERRAARFAKPAELALDRYGDLYVADSMNHSIRKISPAGKVSTIAGLSKIAGFADGINGRARLFNPYGLAFLPDGELVISDAFNQIIREALPPTELWLQDDLGLNLAWKSVIGKTYQVQMAGPGLGDWIDVGSTIHATDFTSEATLGVASDLGIFRVITLP